MSKPTTRTNPRRPWLPPRLDSSPTPSPRPGKGWLFWGGGALLLGVGLLFCHGCHGEEVDDEPILPFVKQHHEERS